jgi:hypothetical protein
MTKIYKMTRAQFNQSLKMALRGIGNDFVNELVRTCPVDTGFLRESIRYEVNDNVINIHMADYAFYVEFGTMPHEITPTTAKALHWKSGGKDIFATHVWHPGTDPQPFIRTAINTKLRDIVYENLVRQISNDSRT